VLELGFDGPTQENKMASRTPERALAIARPLCRTTRRTAKMRGNANAVAIRLPGFADLCPPLTSLAQKDLPTVNSFDYRS
jgi:hypothetical protein